MNELDAIRNEYRRYRSLAEKAFSRLDDAQRNRVIIEDTNSIAMLIRHLGGNLQSRFRNFLTEDGEKPWRNRDAEFEERSYSFAESQQIWSDGWTVLEDTLDSLTLDDLDRTVTIRGVGLSVHEALARSATHVAYHTGQIVLLARLLTEPGQWQSLSIPRGGSADYNAEPTREKQP